ncbi:Nicotinate-nucleotide--dimethylbenzimidazole phosphoribosyltransferase [hydrothermal vent metagenome]|uniref:Nicotinate-nucleotide--dimethylbenzimidazole phosphoribosyltransferase n=1 Tax=hydrothermal vent metagenome TaxID=652676 RepID=A0A3B0XWB3_9ZZZZ
MSELEWLQQSVKIINKKYTVQAEGRQNSLTKPPGSLGRMETVAIQLSAMQACLKPAVDNVYITVFAADHGVADENVSAFPQAVTLEMVRNFSSGGAAISVLAKQLGARLEVVNLGTVSEQENLPGVIDQRISPATENFSQQAAMSASQMVEAMNAGREAVLRAEKHSAQLFIGGDMGIANTTSATAVACALLNEKAENITGPGTGLDKNGVLHKTEVINNSLQKHKAEMKTPLDVLQCVGGFEIAALSGAYIACAQQGLPVMVDGFISGVAALLAIKINSGVKDWMFFSHLSAEPGHKIILQAMQVEPLVQMNMRLGEASGAAVVVPLLRLACALQNNMATFEQAGVSNKN